MILVLFVYIKIPFTSFKSNGRLIFCRFRLKPDNIIHIMLRLVKLTNFFGIPTVQVPEFVYNAYFGSRGADTLDVYALN